MKGKIKVRGLTSAAGSDFSITANDELELPKEIAEDLIRARIAEPVKQKSEKATSKQKTETAAKE